MEQTPTIDTSVNPAKPLVTLDDEIDIQEINPCCQETVEVHAINNPIMVCQHCKQLIKCFKDQRAFRNYLVFCKSRGRKVLAGEHQGYYVVVFRSYETLR